MKITLSYDILRYIYEIYEFECLDGRIQCIAELVYKGFKIELEKKLENREREIVTTISNLKDMEEFIISHFPKFKPTEYYFYI